MKSIVEILQDFSYRELINSRCRESVHEFAQFCDDYYLICLGKSAIYDFETLKSCAPNIKDYFLVSNLSSKLEKHHQSTHPLLTDQSLKVGKLLQEFISKIPKKSNVVVYISGGASAMIDILKSDVVADKYFNQVADLIKSGADIIDLNKFRISHSDFKGGGLAKLLKDCHLLTLVNSDVDKDYKMVSSGPTFFYEHFSHKHKVLISPKDISAPINFQSFGLNGHLEDLKSELIKEYKNSISKGENHITHGEIPTRVTGDGLGGRNTHFVAAMALELFYKNNLMKDNLCLFSFASDGMDGSGNCFGAYFDNEVFSNISIDELISAIDTCDTFTLFKNKKALIQRGPTTINLADLRGIYFS